MSDVSNKIDTYANALIKAIPLIMDYSMINGYIYITMYLLYIRSEQIQN